MANSLSIAKLAGAGTALALVLFCAPASAQQYTYNVIYNFCAQGSCADGSDPISGLIMDSHGNLYGTTESGGSNNSGTIFELSPPASAGGPWTETILYSFCSQSGCSDGEEPYASLIFDAQGNLYGTAAYGGPYGGGVVFQLTPPTGSGPWTYTSLYSFCSQSNCADGSNPLGGLTFDAQQKNLYGTTYGGGATVYNGAVFELSPPTASAGAWTETVLYSFQGSPNDGAYPASGLVFDSQGNLYGTTNGGATYSGAVFELSSPSTNSGPWTETILYLATSPSAPSNLSASLLFDGAGNLYTSSAASACGGAVFELSPPTSGMTWNETTLYDFCSNGGEPQSSLISDAQGNLYGTTYEGGNTTACRNGCGTVYAVSPPIGAGTWTRSVLYSFMYSDGGFPFYSGVIADGNGNLYGTTEFGGAHSSGVVYQLAPLATTTEIVSSQNPSTLGQSVQFTATVSPSAASGTVQFQVDGSNFGPPAIMMAGQAVSGSISTLSAGAHTVSAKYLGTLYYGLSTGNLTQTVNKITPTVSVTGVNPSSILYGSGHMAQVTAALSWTGSGPTPTSAGSLLSFKSTAPGAFGSVTCSGSSSPITCSAEFKPTATDMAGTYTILAGYAGDAVYNSAHSAQTKNFAIAKATPVVALMPTPVTVPHGSTAPVTLTATFTGTGSAAAAPTGAVSFSVPSGAFSGQSCSTSQDVLTCTVTYTPSGALKSGTYSNYITANIAAAGDYKSAGGHDNLVVQ